MLGKIIEIPLLVFRGRQHLILLVSTIQVEHSNSLLFFGTAPLSPPLTMDFNLDSILSIPSLRGHGAGGWGFGLVLFVSASFLLLHFLLDAVCWNSAMKY